MVTKVLSKFSLTEKIIGSVAAILAAQAVASWFTIMGLPARVTTLEAGADFKTEVETYMQHDTERYFGVKEQIALLGLRVDNLERD